MTEHGWLKAAFAATLSCLSCFSGLTINTAWAQAEQPPVDKELEAAILANNHLAILTVVEFKEAGIPITEDGLIETSLPTFAPSAPPPPDASGRRSPGAIDSWRRQYSLRVSALTLLRYLPKSPRVVAALRESLHDPDDLIALSAMSGLHSFKETGWEDEAVRRLLTTSVGTDIRMAGLLARAGRSEGWPLVLAGVFNDSIRKPALGEARHFDGLRGPSGSVIDVKAVLGSLLDLPGEARTEIREAVSAMPVELPWELSEEWLRWEKLYESSLAANIPPPPPPVRPVPAEKKFEGLGAAREEEAIRSLLSLAPVDGIRLAGVLARAGRSEGWPLVLAGVLTDSTRTSALGEIRDFDGLRGRYWVIDVRLVLEALANPSEGMRSDIRDALKTHETLKSVPAR